MECRKLKLNQHSTLRKYFFNFGTLDYGPQKFFCFESYSILVLYPANLTLSTHGRVNRAHRTHHLGRHFMFGRDLTCLKVQIHSNLIMNVFMVGLTCLNVACIYE